MANGDNPLGSPTIMDALVGDILKQQQQADLLEQQQAQPQESSVENSYANIIRMLHNPHRPDMADVLAGFARGILREPSFGKGVGFARGISDAADQVLTQRGLARQFDAETGKAQLQHQLRILDEFRKHDPAAKSQLVEHQRKAADRITSAEDILTVLKGVDFKDRKGLPAAVAKKVRGLRDLANVLGVNENTTNDQLLRSVETSVANQFGLALDFEHLTGDSIAKVVAGIEHRLDDDKFKNEGISTYLAAEGKLGIGGNPDREMTGRFISSLAHNSNPTLSEADRQSAGSFEEALAGKDADYRENQVVYIPEGAPDIDGNTIYSHRLSNENLMRIKELRGRR